MPFNSNLKPQGLRCKISTARALYTETSESGYQQVWSRKIRSVGARIMPGRSSNGGLLPLSFSIWPSSIHTSLDFSVLGYKTDGYRDKWLVILDNPKRFTHLDSDISMESVKHRYWLIMQRQHAWSLVFPGLSQELRNRCTTWMFSHRIQSPMFPMRHAAWLIPFLPKTWGSQTPGMWSRDLSCALALQDNIWFFISSARLHRSRECVEGENMKSWHEMT